MDILRDKADLEFKRDSEAKVAIKKGELVIEKFYPMNLLQKLSLQKESVEDWKELVESVLIDWNYDGAVLQPAVVDIPGKNDLVKGAYKVPDDAGTIRVKITDLLSESWEGSVSNGAKRTQPTASVERVARLRLLPLSVAVLPGQPGHDPARTTRS